jgi:hypothetical protein
MDKDENVLDEVVTDMIDGSVAIQKVNGVRRNCSLTFSNATSIFTPNANGLIYISKKFKLYSGLKINGVNYFPPQSVQGVFNLGSPVLRHDSSANIVTLEGYDNFSLLNGTLAGQIYVTVYKVPLQTLVTDVVSDTLALGEVVQSPIIYENINKTPYTINKEAGNTYQDILTDVAGMVA